MLKSGVLRVAFMFCCLAILWGGVSVASAAGETFKVISVDETGCNAGEFVMTVDSANFDGGQYQVRTVVTVGGLIYMNEDASIFSDGTLSWGIFDLFTYGSVPNPGTYPIPSGQQMQVDFTVERPKGTILSAWRLVVDGCDTGNILFNGEPSSGGAGGGCNLVIPAGSVVGDLPLGAQGYYEPGNVAPGVVLNPGTYTVIGQDKSETYYQVVLACQLIWVRKDTMQPSFEPPQNGAALPTGIVS
ncbi:MAG: hypothetical protein ABI700_04170 [Chloroflexota bacterium]